MGRVFLFSGKTSHLREPKVEAASCRFRSFSLCQRATARALRGLLLREDRLEVALLADEDDESQDSDHD
jgi:hypothetical protein